MVSEHFILMTHKQKKGNYPELIQLIPFSPTGELFEIEVQIYFLSLSCFVSQCFFTKTREHQTYTLYILHHTKLWRDVINTVFT